MPVRRRIAAIVTEYRTNSHSEVIVGRLLGEFGYRPQVEIVSLYTDQVPSNDGSREMAVRYGLPLFPTIAEAIQLPAQDGGLHGVVIIGEHGNYPKDDLRRTQYPRRRFLEETLQAMDGIGLRVPVFSDKFLSWRIEDTLWMYGEIVWRGIPFMGGSAIPHTTHAPAFDGGKLQRAKEWLVLSFSREIEAYGYHALEVLQSLAERRPGGETGVKAITALEGEAVWRAMDGGEWPEELLLRALEVCRRTAEHPRLSREPPVLFIVEYLDGARGYVLQQHDLTPRWGFAFRDDQGEVVSSVCMSEDERPFSHFDILVRLIEQFMVTGREPFPKERVLVSSALINRAMESLSSRVRIETPELNIVYRP
ncbi:hypothetical protein SAMN02799630_01876 [Paenibacillus sp. UNCCL117]|uniref:hypothetical protein n=1 Tax=unclassified Paenibacillus TaxID=185978 RepID=UPI000884E1CA|nr:MULTISPECIES: hypothetical protein [unclassified Paenibacillus]SDC96559.1 hypothetical protein SAMN04488602_104365 [Paenibacillus sp. cl123]SFW30331.1 hypothetical protein SAMN02799630_01876 [Paenibacillus sp. UNCCL117]